MRLVIVLVLSVTAVYNQGFQSGRPEENPGNPRLSPQVKNPRIRRTPNPYYGLHNYLNASPFFNRQAAMTRRYGAARGVLRNPQQPARPTPTRAHATAPAPQRAPQRVPQRTLQKVPQRAPQRVPQRAQAVQRNVNPYGFGRGIGMFGALRGLRDQNRMRGVGGLRGLHGRNQDRSRHLDGIRRMYGAMAGSGWRSYGGSSGGKGSYYYPHTGSTGGHYGGSYKGSYYYRRGGGYGNSGHGHGNSGHGRGNYGHGHSYWRRR